MKKIGEYTVTGSMGITDRKRIILDDGRFDTGYRITKFEIAPGSNASADDVYAKLATNLNVPNTSGHEWQWSSNAEIAWAKNASTGGGASGILEFFIDPDNLVIQDLFIFTGTGTDNTVVNYMIHMEKYDITDAMGALAMVRNRAQA
jgi:hypothetical protein